MQLEKEMYRAGWIFAILFTAGMAVISILPIEISDIAGPCIFHQITGLYCPGCGGTRAVIAFAHCRFLKSFYYHPVVLYGGFVYILFMVRGMIASLSKEKYPYMKFSFIYIYIAIGIIIIQFILKNILLIFYNFAWLG